MIDLTEEKNSPKVSLLLLTHDRYQMTKYCLYNNLANTGFDDFELLILDNGSKDARTVNLSNEIEFPKVKGGTVESILENIGIAAGFNRLLKKAKGDYIVFLSNDILLQDNWLLDLLHYNNEVDNSGLTSIHSEGDKGLYTKVLAHDDSFIHVWKNKNNITSGVSLINKTALDRVGNFDETLGIYGKEREQFAQRVSLSGMNNYYIPGQYSIHLGRDMNEKSEYRANKDKWLQLSANRYTESLNEMKKNNNYHL